MCINGRPWEYNVFAQDRLGSGRAEEQIKITMGNLTKSF